MARHALMYVLSAIILLNIIAIILLNNRVAEQSTAAPQTPPQQAAPTSPTVNTQFVALKPLVRAVILDDPARCPDCYNISQYTGALADVVNVTIEAGDWQQFHAQSVAQNRTPPSGPERLPAIAFNATMAEYPTMMDGWNNVGYNITFASGPYRGTWYVLPTLNPPYYSIPEGKVHGRVGVTYLTMQSCAQCYDVRKNRDALTAARVIPYNETFIDANSTAGKNIILKYNITAVPTILLTPEAAEYGNLKLGWSVVGTVESDGVFVLRDLERTGVTYYDLQTRRVMQP